MEFRRRCLTDYHYTVPLQRNIVKNGTAYTRTRYNNKKYNNSGEFIMTRVNLHVDFFLILRYTYITALRVFRDTFIKSS